MRVLLDENLPLKLRKYLLNHQVETVSRRGWGGLKNGELLKASENALFDVFVTADLNLEYQQNLTHGESGWLFCPRIIGRLSKGTFRKFRRQLMLRDRDHSRVSIVEGSSGGIRAVRRGVDLEPEGNRCSMLSLHSTFGTGGQWGSGLHRTCFQAFCNWSACIFIWVSKCKLRSRSSVSWATSLLSRNNVSLCSYAFTMRSTS
jgi:predicted nuclease of predicted toxin-antitoxin system